MHDRNESVSRGRRRRHAARWAGALLAGALLLAACGSDDDPAEGAGAPGTETTAGGGATTGLGEEKPSAGEPVKVGFVSDGRTQAIDNSSATVVAEAMTAYFNDHRGGIGGRPIELHTCDSLADPSKSADCANEMIREDVVLVVLPSLATLTEVWRPLKEVGIPVFMYSTTDKEVLAETESTFAVGSPTGSLIGIPIRTAKDGGATKVVGVIIDVPAATAIYEEAGEELFGDAGLDFELMKIPLGQPDLTPQMSRIASQDDVAVHIVGTDTLAISALSGLQAAGFDGPISCIGCDADSVRQAIGSDLEGVVVGAQGKPIDGDTTDVDLYHAILDEYSSGIDDADEQVPLYTYLAWATAREALEGIEGEITAETIIETITSMPNRPLPTYAGAQFRCNGKADPVYPAACSNTTPIGVLDADGNPTDIKVTNKEPIPD